MSSASERACLRERVQPIPFPLQRRMKAAVGASF